MVSEMVLCECDCVMSVMCVINHLMLVDGEYVCMHFLLYSVIYVVV